MKHLTLLANSSIRELKPSPFTTSENVMDTTNESKDGDFTVHSVVRVTTQNLKDLRSLYPFDRANAPLEERRKQVKELYDFFLKDNSSIIKGYKDATAEEIEAIRTTTPTGGFVMVGDTAWKYTKVWLDEYIESFKGFSRESVEGFLREVRETKETKEVKEDLRFYKKRKSDQLVKQSNGSVKKYIELSRATEISGNEDGLAKLKEFGYIPFLRNGKLHLKRGELTKEVKGRGIKLFIPANVWIKDTQAFIKEVKSQL